MSMMPCNHKRHCKECAAEPLEIAVAHLSADILPGIVQQRDELAKENQELRTRIKELEALLDAKDKALLLAKNAVEHNWAIDWNEIDQVLALTPESVKQKIAARDAVIEAGRKLGGFRHYSGVKPEYIEIQCDQGWDDFVKAFKALDALKESEK